MGRLQSSVLFLAVLVAMPTFTWGQGDACYDAYLVATYDGAAMQLQLSVGHRNFGPMICRANAVAFDVFRKTLGYECGSEVRVTDQPIAWPVTEDPVFVFEAGFTDPNVTPDTAYRYEARLVDAERNPAQGIMPPFDGSVWGYGVVGVALLAHGQVFPGDNFSYVLQPCPGECFATGLVGAIVPLGTTLLLYGNGVVNSYYSNMWLPLLYVISTSPAQCVVAVEPVRWSTVKRLYK